MATTVTVKVDLEGRLTIPPHVQRRLGIKPGDTFVVECDDVRKTLRFTKAESPFDLLVEHALKEYHAGRPHSLRDFAADNSIALDDV